MPTRTGSRATHGPRGAGPQRRSRGDLRFALSRPDRRAVHDGRGKQDPHGITNVLFGSSLTDMETCYKVMRGDIARSLRVDGRSIRHRAGDHRPPAARRQPDHRAAGAFRGTVTVGRQEDALARWLDGPARSDCRTVPHAMTVTHSTYGRAARLIAAAAAIAAAVAGLVWGTHVAGGPDSYCYLSQAELFASGHVMHIEPLAAKAPWEHGADAFVPVGHVPAFDRADGSVPMCSPGYPIAMALVRHAGGRTAMFGVVPILGAVAVWLTFILGRRISGPASGAVAAVLMAASPPFLYQIVQPMSDVPAAALWAAALVAVTNPRFPSALTRAALGGVATGAALLVRPNLAPLAGVVALAVFCERPVQPRAVLRTWIDVRGSPGAVRDSRGPAAERDVRIAAQVGLRQPRASLQARTRVAESSALSGLASPDGNTDCPARPARSLVVAGSPGAAARRLAARIRRRGVRVLHPV